MKTAKRLGAVALSMLAGALLAWACLSPANSVETEVVAFYPVANLVEASVLVDSKGGSGSGVVFRNGESWFVWTDAHVLENFRRASAKGFEDTFVYQNFVYEGRQAGGQTTLAKIIRYCQPEDIALLKLYGPGRGSVFFAPEDYIPKQGEALWHVGSFLGEHGCNSLSSGIIAAIGRLRFDGRPVTTGGFIYDQASINACHCGSSGGGFFRKSDGACIGLVTEYMGPGYSHGSMCFTPSRRLWAFARREACLWAMLDSVEVPGELGLIESTTIEIIPHMPSSE